MTYAQPHDNSVSCETLVSRTLTCGRTMGWTRVENQRESKRASRMTRAFGFTRHAFSFWLQEQHAYSPHAALIFDSGLESPERYSLAKTSYRPSSAVCNRSRENERRALANSKRGWHNVARRLVPHTDTTHPRKTQASFAGLFRVWPLF